MSINTREGKFFTGICGVETTVDIEKYGEKNKEQSDCCHRHCVHIIDNSGGEN